MTTTSADVETWQDHAVATVLDLDLRKAPLCECRFEKKPEVGCSGVAQHRVRFESHGGCVRDGKCHLICKPCLNWIILYDVACVHCMVDLKVLTVDSL